MRHSVKAATTMSKFLIYRNKWDACVLIISEMLYKFLRYSASALKKFDPLPTAAFHGPAEFRGWSNRNASREGADFTPTIHGNSCRTILHNVRIHVSFMYECIVGEKRVTRAAAADRRGRYAECGERNSHKPLFFSQQNCTPTAGFCDLYIF